ncbi:TrkH family potassium uptake protein [Butyrivibrio sp. LC3010]|uniref:TrkH family potassium uptake protein n=1 Tax=Butyrivibrio sp. LC3010 TaxID=1280680 RepID=UPI00040954CB|nr:potassium transporter TrkG [Butyrivibrio sp. LC3010]
MTELFNLKKFKPTPVQIIPASFFITILMGTILLMLPFSSSNGNHTGFVTALFTATTSVCVTGLVVVDTYAHWSLFGQLIILILIQIGGLGMITIASMLMVITHRKFTLGDRLLLQDSFNLNSNSKLLLFLIRVLKGTFIMEGIGAIFYSFVFIPEFGVRRGLWISVFNAISAFCNAGMDIIGPNSLIDYRSNPIVMSVTMILIVMGGIGFVVWFDILHTFKQGLSRRFSPFTIITRLSEHSKLVITFTGILIISGMLLFLLTEYNNPYTIGELGFGAKLANSLFESITLRTAGFATFSQEKLTISSCLIAYVLMFIGGSPIGTAGGIKTVTIFLLIMNVKSYVAHLEEDVVFKRRVTSESMRKASAVAFIGAVAIFTLSLLLSIVNPAPLEDILFEIISACGTVGLTRGMTSSLNIGGRLTVILAMYLGRIGPVSLVALLSRKKYDKNKINHAEGTFYVG